MNARALELAPHSNRVNTIHPGGTGTDMTQNTAAEHWQATAPGVSETLELPLPIHRMETTDVAHLVRWLVSDEARYITGTTRVLDAGALLRGGASRCMPKRHRPGVRATCNQRGILLSE